MSDQEQTKLMMQNLASKFDEHCDYVKKELGEIKRGVYGDPANKVPGLIDRQLEDEKRLSALEEGKKQETLKKKTIAWVIGTVWAALQAAGIFIYEIFFNK